MVDIQHNIDPNAHKDLFDSIGGGVTGGWGTTGSDLEVITNANNRTLINAIYLTTSSTLNLPEATDGLLLNITDGSYPTQLFFPRFSYSFYKRDWVTDYWQDWSCPGGNLSNQFLPVLSDIDTRMVDQDGVLITNTFMAVDYNTTLGTLPETNAKGIVYIMYYNSLLSQMYYSLITDLIAYRRNSGSTWSTWIDTTSGNGGSSGGVKTYYGTCTSNGSEIVKIVTVSEDQDFKLEDGICINIKFSYDDIQATVRYLNVNNTSAKQIRYYGLTSNVRLENDAIESFVYDKSLDYWIQCTGRAIISSTSTSIGSSYGLVRYTGADSTDNNSVLTAGAAHLNKQRFTACNVVNSNTNVSSSQPGNLIIVDADNITINLPTTFSYYSTTNNVGISVVFVGSDNMSASGKSTIAVPNGWLLNNVLNGTVTIHKGEFVRVIKDVNTVNNYWAYGTYNNIDGWGVPVLESSLVDANDLTLFSKIYRTGLSTLNLPAPAGGNLVNINNSGFIVQLYFSGSNEAMWIRRYNASSSYWYDWCKPGGNWGYTNLPTLRNVDVIDSNNQYSDQPNSIYMLHPTITTNGTLPESAPYGILLYFQISLAIKTQIYLSSTSNLVCRRRTDSSTGTWLPWISDSTVSMPSSTYITLSADASGSTYTAPADGYVRMEGNATAANQYVQLIGRLVDTRYSFQAQFVSVYIPVSANDQITYNYNIPTLGTFRFIYAQGAV